jgi:hypothetical protein
MLSSQTQTRKTKRKPCSVRWPLVTPSVPLRKMLLIGTEMTENKEQEKQPAAACARANQTTGQEATTVRPVREMRKNCRSQNTRGPRLALLLPTHLLSHPHSSQLCSLCQPTSPSPVKPSVHMHKENLGKNSDGHCLGPLGYKIRLHSKRFVCSWGHA